MAYVFKTKDEVVEYLRQMEFTFGDDYSFYIVPHHMYTTRFNIFYKGTNCGFVENENFKDISSNLWVINIPAEKRAFLEAEQPGIYEAIYNEPTNADGDIDKKYYVDPDAFTRIIVRDSKNTQHILRANGPGAAFGLKFANDFVKIDDTEIAKDTTQVTVSIDSKALANKLRYDLAETVGNYTVTEPQSITVKNISEYPSVIVAKSMDSRPTWVPLSTLEVNRAAVAARAESLDGVELDKFITTDNFIDNFSEILINSKPYGLDTAYDTTTGKPFIFARSYDINLIGDISGTATVENFDDVDIECKLAPEAIEKIANRTGKHIVFGTDKFTINNMDITYDEDKNVVFNVPENKVYKFNINDTTAFTINTGGGNDIAEEFSADPDLTYNDGDLVGICNDGIVRPLSFSGVISYIGVVTKNPAVTCGTINDNHVVKVALMGKKVCEIKVRTRNIMGLIGRKVIASKDEGTFVLWDDTFDNDKVYNGIIIGGIYETPTPGVIKATILLK